MRLISSRCETQDSSLHLRRGHTRDEKMGSMTATCFLVLKEKILNLGRPRNIEVHSKTEFLPISSHHVLPSV